jgi:Ala-tRNA(Pro) deacylase
MNQAIVATAPEDTYADMPTPPQTVLDRLTAMNIPFVLHHHPAVFTVEESEKFEHDIPGLHCRNLFLRDRKKNNFLVCLPNAVAVDMKKLPPLIGADRLSFGSVCPFSIMNDTGNQVKICLETSMMAAELVNFHPLINTMTIGLKPSDVVKFIESCGHKPYMVDLSTAKP